MSALDTEADAHQLTHRVAACAAGLAFAERDDPEGLQQLIDMAAGCADVLGDARARLVDLGTIDGPVLRRAARLLDRAVLAAEDTTRTEGSGPLWRDEVRIVTDEGPDPS